MQLEINVIDTFTDSVFKGNSAAVIITDSWLDDGLMQSIAMENNLSETAFLVADNSDGLDALDTLDTLDTLDALDALDTLEGTEQSDKVAGYHIRWFSPLTEIDFCGHATLASAFVVFKKQPTLTSIKFSAKAVGILTVVQTDFGKIQMDFPNTKPEKVESDSIPQSLLAGLSIAPVEVYRNAQAYFVIYNSESEVLSVERDNAVLKQLAPLDVVVTCQAQSASFAEYDFISRYFWPANGGGEDPVTGSIHTGLAPLWAERLGRNQLLAYQASSRGGIVDSVVADDRVLISGKAVQYMTGFITL